MFSECNIHNDMVKLTLFSKGSNYLDNIIVQQKLLLLLNNHNWVSNFISNWNDNYSGNTKNKNNKLLQQDNSTEKLSAGKLFCFNCCLSCELSII